MKVYLQIYNRKNSKEIKKIEYARMFMNIGKKDILQCGDEKLEDMDIQLDMSSKIETDDNKAIVPPRLFILPNLGVLKKLVFEAMELKKKGNSLTKINIFYTIVQVPVHC